MAEYTEAEMYAISKNGEERPRLLITSVIEDEDGTAVGISIDGVKDGDITEVDIPNEIDGLPVTVIGKAALTECRLLQRVTLPKHLQIIGQSAF